MKSLGKLLLGFVLILPLFYGNTYYASPTGTGACTIGDPCQMATAIAKLAAGDTLFMLDGTYTGATSMIAVTDLNGTTGSGKITIQAQNDGGVRIDGEDARIPILLTHTEYIVVQGMNACNSSQSVVTIQNTDGHGQADGYNEIKRVVAWDSRNGILSTDNHHVFGIALSNHDLWEDCAGFGVGRKIFGVQTGDNNTGRRLWARWNEHLYESPKQGIDICYDSDYNLWENCIVEWDDLSASANLYGLFSTGAGMYYHENKNGHMRILGSIGLHLTTLNSTDPYVFFSSGIHLTGSTLANNVAYIEDASSAAYPFFLNDTVAGGASTSDHMTSIYGTGGQASYIAGNWTNTNFLETTTVGAYNMYTNTGAGATIRYRTVDGVPSSPPVPLWPWAMNDRISAAFVQAGRSPYSVDTTIQSKFGTYPSEAGTSNSGSRIRVRRPE